MSFCLLVSLTDTHTHTHICTQLISCTITIGLLDTIVFFKAYGGHFGLSPFFMSCFVFMSANHIFPPTRSALWTL